MLTAERGLVPPRIRKLAPGGAGEVAGYGVYPAIKVVVPCDLRDVDVSIYHAGRSGHLFFELGKFRRTRVGAGGGHTTCNRSEPPVKVKDDGGER